ncbi:MAG TPA: hypothetical protein VMY42_11115 [Thermoguttaceae bacterium]|nr:hypothetical protein [Thermoguttaceae bacterium]
MENRERSGEYRLEREADAAVHEMVGRFRGLLIRETVELAMGEDLHPRHLEEAYRKLLRPTLGDAQAIISRTLRENRVIESVSYLMAAAMFVFGLALLCIGIFADDSATYRVASIIGGSVVELLLLLPLRFAINSRRHNIAIRMLGILLDRVDDPKKLSTLLKDTFLAVVLGNSLSSGVR